MASIRANKLVLLTKVCSYCSYFNASDYKPGFTIRSNEALTSVSTTWHVNLPSFSSMDLIMDNVWLYRPFTENKSAFVDLSAPLKLHLVIALTGIVLHVTLIDCPSVTMMASDGRRINDLASTTAWRVKPWQSDQSHSHNISIAQNKEFKQHGWILWQMFAWLITKLCNYFALIINLVQ